MDIQHILSLYSFLSIVILVIIVTSKQKWKTELLGGFNRPCISFPIFSAVLLRHGTVVRSSAWL